MNFKFIHPLFDDRDVEAASTYMATLMSNSDRIAVQDGDNSTDIDPSIVSAIIKGYIQNSMGKHVVDISNFAIVQEKFYQVYANAYENFLKFAKLDAKIVYFNGAAQMLPYVLPRASSKLKDGVIRPYNPKDEYWNLLDSRIFPREDLASPIIGYHDVVLTIKTDNFEFADEAWYLSNECARSSKNPRIMKSINARVLAEEPVELSFRLLPNKDYVIIHRVLSLLHKYF